MSTKPLPERDFGIEIEFRHPTHDSYSGVRPITDALRELPLTHGVREGSSTREHWCVNWENVASLQYGFELKSPILRGEAGVAELQTVMRALGRMGCHVDGPLGMHLHINRADLTPLQLRNWAWGYMRFQKQIDKLVAPRRVGVYAYNKPNAYYMMHTCDPASDALMARVRAALTGSVEGVRNTLSAMEKGPNFSIRHIPTVELRQHQSTLNPARAGHWIRLMLWLCETAKDEPELPPLVDGADEAALRAFLRYTGAPEMTRRYMLNQSRAIANAKAAGDGAVAKLEAVRARKKRRAA